ncbi:hypothetical protein DL770_005615 [Monosporascus sp. CRB-9-2]|nr:hypothetical protein DL770_005615 [Monosporascus sp. CRB-9-2]
MAELVQNMPEPHVLAADFDANIKAEGGFRAADDVLDPRAAGAGGSSTAAVLERRVLRAELAGPVARAGWGGCREDPDVKVPEEAIPEWFPKELRERILGEAPLGGVERWIITLFAMLPKPKSLSINLADERTRTPCAASASSFFQL